MRFRFIQSSKPAYLVDEMCECLEVSQSGYYAWRKRGPGKRSKQDDGLKERIDELHKKSKRGYGYRPIYHHLKDEKVDCGRDRTLRLMNEMGIEGLQKKSFHPLGTDSRHGFGYSLNLLRTLGHADRCDQVWVADTTYLPSKEGWSYLSTVMDLFSWRIIGWSVSGNN